MKMMTLVKQEKSELVVSLTSPESHRAIKEKEEMPEHKYDI